MVRELFYLLIFEARYRYFEARYRYFEARHQNFEARYPPFKKHQRCCYIKGSSAAYFPERCDSGARYPSGNQFCLTSPLMARREQHLQLALLVNHSCNRSSCRSIQARSAREPGLGEKRNNSTKKHRMSQSQQKSVKNQTEYQNLHRFTEIKRAINDRRDAKNTSSAKPLPSLCQTYSLHTPLRRT